MLFLHCVYCTTPSTPLFLPVPPQLFFCSTSHTSQYTWQLPPCAWQAIFVTDLTPQLSHLVAEAGIQYGTLNVVSLHTTTQGLLCSFVTEVYGSPSPPPHRAERNHRNPNVGGWVDGSAGWSSRDGMFFLSKGPPPEDHPYNRLTKDVLGPKGQTRAQTW